MAAGEQVSEQSGGFALSEKKEKNKSGVTKLSEVDDWRAMRDAAAQEAAEDAEVKVETEAKAEVDESAANESIGTSGLVLEEDGSLNMFWIDAYEDSAKPGRIYMFGKVRTGVLQTLRSTLALRGAKVLHNLKLVVLKYYKNLQVKARAALHFRHAVCRLTTCSGRSSSCHVRRSWMQRYVMRGL